MKLTTPLENGFLPEKYAKHAPSENKIDGGPVTSMPLKIEDIPTGTKSLALIMVDDDAIPVCGFTWIHWVTIITDPTIKELPEDASQKNPDYLIQGKNSLAGQFVNEQNPAKNMRYSGPEPPDADHEYELNLVALDVVPDLKEGFWLNDLKRIIEDHRIDQTYLRIWAHK